MSYVSTAPYRPRVLHLSAYRARARWLEFAPMHPLLRVVAYAVLYFVAYSLTTDAIWQVAAR